MTTVPQEMVGVREYAEGYAVKLVTTSGSFDGRKPECDWPGHGRIAVRAMNEGGCACTEIDLLDLISWVKANRPDMLV